MRASKQAIRTRLTIQRCLCCRHASCDQPQSDGQPASPPTHNPLPSCSSALIPSCHNNPEVHDIERGLCHVYDTLRRRESVLLQPRQLAVDAVYSGVVTIGREDWRMPFVARERVRAQEDVGRVPDREGEGKDRPADDGKAGRVRPGHCV